MFYVGTYSTFRGKDSVEKTKVKDVEKLGHSRGRGVRYLEEHKPLRVIELDGAEVYRSVVFALPERFRLTNDVIKLAIKEFKCDWQTAKFHCYRMAAQDVIGNQEDWAEVFPTAPVADTAEPQHQVVQAGVPQTHDLTANLPVQKEVDSLPV